MPVIGGRVRCGSGSGSPTWPSCFSGSLLTRLARPEGMGVLATKGGPLWSPSVTFLP